MRFRVWRGKDGVRGMEGLRVRLRVGRGKGGVRGREG